MLIAHPGPSAEIARAKIEICRALPLTQGQSHADLLSNTMPPASSHSLGVQMQCTVWLMSRFIHSGPASNRKLRRFKVARMHVARTPGSRSLQASLRPGEFHPSKVMGSGRTRDVPQAYHTWHIFELTLLTDSGSR